MFFGCAIVIAAVAFFPTTELSFNESCEVAGSIQKLKSIVQGKRYWTMQLQLLDQEVQYLDTLPERIRKVQQIVDEKTNEALEKNRLYMEELYSKHPELRPSRNQVIADELRKKANALEHAASLEDLQRLNAKRILALRTCRPTILQMAQ